MKQILVATCGAVILWLVLSRVLTAQIAPYGGAREYVADLAERRAKAMAALGPESVLVLWSAPTRTYSADIDYKYRQESNLLYLTGIDQERTILVLVPGATSKKEFLFVESADPQRELWFSHVLTPRELTARSGIANIYSEGGTEAFQAFMTGLLSGVGYEQSPSEATREFGQVFAAVAAGRARLVTLDAVSGPQATEDADQAAHSTWVRQALSRFAGLKSVGAREALSAERQIKTPYEQKVLTASAAISAAAHIEGMKATRPGRWEYEVQAAVEQWFLRSGALSLGYPSIVGSGPNATTLHYMTSTRQMQSGDLLLVDAAGNYQGLTADITRTYPVNGKFSPNQRALYDLVLRAQAAGMAAATPGRRVNDVTAAVRAVFTDGLPRLGLASPTASLDLDSQVSLWFPHGPTHGIGMDVHEPVDTLNPGTAFTIEPGLYIRQDALDRLPKTPGNLALVETLRPAVEKYRDMGVRIEDSFLMTTTGPVMLSGKAPRQVADIERIVGTGR